MTLFNNLYKGRRILVTGHTGFKGSWLTLWLQEMGAIVTGTGLSPITSPNHWDLLDLDIADNRLDIRDTSAMSCLISECQPEIVFHLAAQPLVRRSYHDPIETWSTNVMGTANVLEACRRTDSVCAIVVVTTDKVYENREWSWGYREIERLGGHDPYSASKAATELVSDSYRRAFFNSKNAPLLATARAGNVIGGGDWSEDRLIPDVVRTIAAQTSLEIRSPHATRPWQHVLDCLSGYLLLGQMLLEGKHEFTDAWNFGPSPEDNRTVSEILSDLGDQWKEFRWHSSAEPQYHEAGHLYLDSSKARSVLGWRPVLRLDKALALTTGWYRAYLEEGRVTSRSQLEEYFSVARTAGLSWCRE